MNAIIEISEGRRKMHIGTECNHCGSDTRCRRRDFSEQAWSVLLVWGEVQKDAVDQPICDGCYTDLRDILIDRADEMNEAIADPKKYAAKVAKATAVKPKKKAAASAKKKATASAKKKKAVKKKRTSKVA